MAIPSLSVSRARTRAYTHVHACVYEFEKTHNRTWRYVLIISPFISQAAEPVMHTHTHTHMITRARARTHTHTHTHTQMIACARTQTHNTQAIVGEVSPHMVSSVITTDLLMGALPLERELIKSGQVQKLSQVVVYVSSSSYNVMYHVSSFWKVDGCLLNEQRRFLLLIYTWEIVNQVRPSPKAQPGRSIVGVYVEEYSRSICGGV